MTNTLELMSFVWPMLIAFVMLIIMIAKMHAAIAVLNEKVKVLFEIVNK